MLANWLTNSAYWREYARFYPDAVDDRNGNLIALFLGTLIYRVFVRNPGLMLEYWLRIALVMDWLEQKQENVKEIDAIAKKLHHFLEIKTQDSTLHLVSRFAAWDMAYDAKLGIRLSGINIPYDRVRNADHAMFELYGKYYSTQKKPTFTRTKFLEYVVPGRTIAAIFEETSTPHQMRGWHKACLDKKWNYRRTKGTGFEGYFVNSIRGVIKRMDDKSGCVAEIPLQLVVSGQSSSFGVYSFLRIISVIGDLIALLYSADSQNYSGPIEKILNAATWVRDYPMPSTDGKIENAEVDDLVTSDDDADDDGETDNTESGSEDDTSDRKILVEALSKWLQHHNTRWKEDPSAVAPVILARMWTRFSSTFDAIRDKLRHTQSRYLGVVFHRVTIAFMHSIGVEEAHANELDLPRSVRKNNPVTSGMLFLRFLRHFQKLQGQSPAQSGIPEMRLFELLFSCPIWGFFLARTESDDGLQDYENIINNEIFEIYCKTVASFYPGKNSNCKDLEHLWTVSVSEPGTSGNAAEFKGLHDILNTIYMQRQPVNSVKTKTASSPASDKP
jgi:hypothetical protein